MARKSPDMLKSTPVKLHKRDTDFLAAAKKKGTPEGTEEAFQRYLDAGIKNAESWARMDRLGKAVDAKGERDPQWPAFLAAVDEYGRTSLGEMRSLDNWMYVVAHKDDDVLPANDELFDIINASMSDKLDELQFSLKSTGLLAAKVAQAIKADVIEHEFEDMPLCDDDKED